MPSTYDAYALVKDVFDALEWIGIIVVALLLMEVVVNLPGGDDDDPDGYT